MPPRDPDPAFLAFLRERLAEETARTSERTTDRQRGTALLAEIVATIDAGDRPDQMSLDLLTVAYSRHPDFQVEWNRWRVG